MKCDFCRNGIHQHDGRCSEQAMIVFRTSGGPIEKPTRCDCVEARDADPRARTKEADTQMEVAFAG